MRTSVQTLQRDYPIIPAYSVFFGHGRVQRVGARWEESLRLRTHANFILSYESLKEAIYFAIRTSISSHHSAFYTSEKENDEDVA